jgi:hypothetical protein
MWQEWFVMGAWYWSDDKGNKITITHRHQYDVDLNNVNKTSRATFEEAKAIADRYMEEHP